MKRMMTALLVLSLGAASPAAWALTEQQQTVQDAIAVLNDFVNIPENAIPPALLSEAYGIAIIPSVIKAGFIVGGRYGEGILSVRTADGTWSHPVFIDLAGASVGWQIGAASSDIILVFKTQRGVDQIVNGQVTLGADISIAAGPIGRTASAATNLQMDAEIYSYSRSRGLFVGVALEGGVITIDAEANWRYYGDMVASRTILHRSDRSRLPATGQRLIYTLDRYMPPINTSVGVVPYGAVSTTGSGDGKGQAPARGGGQAQSYGDGPTQPHGAQVRPRSTMNAPHGNDYGPVYGGGQSQPSSGTRSADGNYYGPVYSSPRDGNGTTPDQTSAGGKVYRDPTGAGY